MLITLGMMVINIERLELRLISYKDLGRFLLSERKLGRILVPLYILSCTSRRVPPRDPPSLRGAPPTIGGPPRGVRVRFGI